MKIRHVGRGLTYQIDGENTGAIADYTEAIRLDPKNVKAYSRRGYTYSEMGQYDLVLADLSEVIQLDPLNGNTYYNRGALFLQRALADLKKYTETAPRDTDAQRV